MMTLMLCRHSIAMGSVVGDISTSALRHLGFVILYCNTSIPSYKRRPLSHVVVFPIALISLCCISPCSQSFNSKQLIIFIYYTDFLNQCITVIWMDIVICIPHRASLYVRGLTRYAGLMKRIIISVFIKHCIMNQGIKL